MPEKPQYVQISTKLPVRKLWLSEDASSTKEQTIILIKKENISRNKKSFNSLESIFFKHHLGKFSFILPFLPSGSVSKTIINKNWSGKKGPTTMTDRGDASKKLFLEIILLKYKTVLTQEICIMEHAGKKLWPAQTTQSYGSRDGSPWSDL